jgi:peptidoglycan/LPS O-acetylase OafA/YrhL
MLTAREKFNSLELARMTAAILVLFFHIDKYYFSNLKYYSQSLFGGFFKFGHSGVEFFLFFPDSL